MECGPESDIFGANCPSLPVSDRPDSMSLADATTAAAAAAADAVAGAEVSANATDNAGEGKRTLADASDPAFFGFGGNQTLGMPAGNNNR